MCHMCRGIPLLLLIGAGLRSQPASSPRPDELLEQALVNHRELAAVRQRIAEAKGVLRQAGVRPAPTLDLSGASGQPLRTQGEESYSASISRQFETAGKRSKRVRVAEYGVALAEAELAERIVALKREIRIAMADAAASQEKLRILDDLLKVQQDSLRLTEARVSEGDAARLEADLIHVEIGRIEVQRTTALGEVEADLLDLQRLTGADAVRSVTVVPAPAVSFEPADLRRIALDKRPDLIVARLMEQQTSATVDLSVAEGRPDVTISAGYSHETGRFDDQLGLSPSGSPVQLRDIDNILSVGVSIPLTGRRRNAGNIEAASARAAAARLRREFLERSIPAQTDAAVRRYEALRKSVALTRDGVLTPSEKNLEIIRQSYQLGQLRLLDVLNEQRRLLETRMSLVDSIAELRRALAEIESAVGGTLP